MGILANENAISTSGYSISNSLRFQSASSQYLAKTLTTPTNNLKWTSSTWVKRGQLGVEQKLISAGTSINLFAAIGFSPTDNIDIRIRLNGTTDKCYLASTAVFRDPSAWYHVVVVYDTTQAVQADRLKLYVNNVQYTLTNFSGAGLALNDTSAMNSAVAHSIGSQNYTAASYLDGYLAENYFIDGQALTPSSFGSTDPTSGQWVAKKYTGTYGTNGFYLPFSNGTSTTTLGADSSGNANNWTLTNFTRSAGVSDCFMFDVPSGNGSGSGTQPSSNYCVLNPLNTGLAPTAANLNLSQGAASWVSAGSTIYPTSGKYYFETFMSAISGSNYLGTGLKISGAVGAENVGQVANSWGIITNSTNLSTYTGNVSTNSTVITATSTMAFQVAVDFDAGKMWFGYNNTWLASGNPSTGANPTYTFTANTQLQPIVSSFANTISINLGQRSFAYTPPTGFKALCTANLPASTIVQGNKYMDATTYTGTGASLAVTNTASFKPDFVWVKGRSGATDHALYDSVRGTTLDLVSNTTAAETTQSTGLTAFNTNGFTVGALAKMNTNTATYVGWQWQAGQGSTSSNTNGSITSTTSVNATAGFSIVTWTGNGTTGATIGHGLGIAPKMIIAKTRGIVQNWVVYRPEIGNSNVLLLNSSSAAFADGAWNSTTPTSSVFTVNNGQGVNQASATYVAYCFAEIAGFSKFNSYVGNGSADGTFVYTGFRPKFVMIKSSTAVDDWRMYDASRPSYNVIGGTLLADTAGAETTAAEIDFTSNGFKLRITTTPNAAQTYIYAAFASNPFAQSNAV